MPTWAADLVPVDMDGAARMLGISRRFLVDVIQSHKHYGPRASVWHEFATQHAQSVLSPFALFQKVKADVQHVVD